MTFDGDLLQLIGHDVTLKRKGSTNGGEYAGPCPFCGGRDRFLVWPNHPDGGQWWCRKCDKTGDAIAYLVERGELTPSEAGRIRRGEDPARPWPVKRTTSPAIPAPRHPERLQPPGPEWQSAARDFVARCELALWAPGGERALAWLRGRGVTDDTIKTAGLGYHDADRYGDPAAWGLDRESLWLPRGIVIPWVICGTLWRVNIRRPAGDPKYFSPAGFVTGLYNADALTTTRPAILVEGEFDALTLGQVAGDVVTPVATGSTDGGRRPRWIAAMAICPEVLVAYDADDAGEKAAAWWTGVLSNGRRWRPLWEDANAMQQAGADVRAWVMAALDPKPSEPSELAEARKLAADAEAAGVLPTGTGFATWAAWLADVEAALCPTLNTTPRSGERGL